MQTRLWVFVVLWAFAGCATAPKSTEEETTKVPTAAELRAMVAEPIEPDTSKLRKRAPVAPWTLVGPQPKMWGTVPAKPSNDFEAMLVSSVPGELSTAGQCLARELGNFVHKEGMAPPNALRKYMIQWCGASGRPRIGWRTYRKPREDGAAERFYDDVKGWFDEADASTEYGGWVSPDGKVGLAVFWKRLVDFEPVPLVSNSPFVTIQGQVRPEAKDRFEAVSAASTVGPYETSYCNRDPTVAYPQFSIQCRRVEQTTFVRVTGNLAASDRISSGIMNAAVFGTEPGLNFRPPPIPEFPVASAEEFVPALVGAINELRRDAGLDPLELSLAQSKTVGEIRPRLDAALDAEDYKTADALVAGMGAGWDVDGDIISSDWVTDRIAPTAMNDLLTYLWRSASRGVLFSPEARWAAIHFTPGGHLTMAVYDAIPDEHYNRRVARVYRRIDALREAYGKPKSRRMGALNSEMKEIADDVSAGKISPEKGQKRIGEAGIGKFKGRWWYNRQVTSDLSRVYITPKLLQADHLEVGVGVSVVRPPKSAHARYVVFFIWPND